MTDWIYNGAPLLEPIDGVYGFLYAIYTPNGKVYYGKKAFTYNTKKKVTKKEIKETGTRKRVKRIITDSQWRNYYGSSKPLLEWLKENGKEEVVRIVLGFAKTKQDLAYWETVMLIREEVLFREDCWNGNIASRYFKGKINKLL